MTKKKQFPWGIYSVLGPSTRSSNGTLAWLGEFSTTAPFQYCPNEYQLSLLRSWQAALLAAAVRAEMFSSVGIAYAWVSHWEHFHLLCGEHKMWVFHESHAETTQSTTNKTSPRVIWKQEVQMQRHEVLLKEPMLPGRAIPSTDKANHEKQPLSPPSSLCGTKD